MFEEKESIWRKKGFYVSVCTALVCLLTIGTVYYRMNRSTEEDSLWAAKESASPAVGEKSKLAEAGNTAEPEETEDAETVTKSMDESLNSTQKKVKETEKRATGTEKKKKATATPKAKETVANQSKKEFSFKEDNGLLWPVQGDVIMKFNMNGTAYFKTLAQYRCNPAVIISAKEGTKVKAAADGEITSVKKREETGLTVTMNIGNDYTLVYGQLKGVSLAQGDKVSAGDVIGSIAAPTQYYTEEGSNLYFQVKEKKESIDPLLLLK